VLDIRIGDRALRDKIRELETRVKALELENELLALVNERIRRQIAADIAAHAPPAKA
jgi:regulator of replication initiation timing